MSEWRVLFAGLAALNVGMGCVDLMLHGWAWPVSFAAAAFVAFIGAKS